MNRRLPFKTPKITCYNQHANLLAIISQTDDYLPWFYNNYFQLQFTNYMSNCISVIFLNRIYPQFGHLIPNSNHLEKSSLEFADSAWLNRYVKEAVVRLQFLTEENSPPLIQSADDYMRKRNFHLQLTNGVFVRKD